MLESILPILTVLILVFIWEIASRNNLIPHYILPIPTKVLNELFAEWEIILLHTWPTMSAIVLGYIMAFLFAVTMAILSFYFRFLKLTIEPILMASQVIPKIAIAPALLIIFDNGMTFRIVVATIIAFFPLYANISHGLRMTNDELILQARLVGKSAREIFFIRCVYAIPFVASASKSGILLSTIGVLIAEFLGADKGIGYLTLDSSAQSNFNLSFAGIFSITIISAILYFIITIAGEKAMTLSRLNKKIERVDS